jgi:hypothetical protein
MLEEYGNAVIPASGKLPAIILSQTPAKTNHPYVPILLHHIRQEHAPRTLAGLLAAVYRGTLRIHRLLAYRYPQQRWATRICIGTQSFLWLAYKAILKLELAYHREHEDKTADGRVQGVRKSIEPSAHRL